MAECLSEWVCECVNIPSVRMALETGEINIGAEHAERIAQLVEHCYVKPMNPGSNPGSVRTFS